MYHPFHQEPQHMLARSGLRVTRPRKAIADILFKGGYHHFTADEVLAATRDAKHSLSLATVYNTLNDFAAHGLVRRLATTCGPSQFDTSLGDHHHFHVESDGRVIDIARIRLLLRGCQSLPQATELSISTS
jgi:Fur family iron response transcriptional regulator